MGYDTYYSLDILKSNEELTEEIETWIENNLPDFFECVVDINRDAVRRYDPNDDLIILSSKWPNMEFKLWGNGEDDDDRWVGFAWGGQVYYDVWRPPTFDVKKMPQYKQLSLYEETWNSVLLLKRDNKDNQSLKLPSLVLDKIQNYIFGNDLKNLRNLTFLD